MRQAMKFQSVKGMDDLFSPEIEKWRAVERKSADFFEAHGFREIRTPILESTDLFKRSIGEATDIVHKEMYTFEDRGGRSLTLRPEMTAAVVRAVLEHDRLKENEPLFVYYLGPMFRAERPQAGRRRQFHQIGVETLNTRSAANDAELMLMVKNYLDWLGLKRYVVKLNHLGSAEDRADFVRRLGEYFTQVQSKLCPDCQYRLTKNVLRIFDCKEESCQPLIEGAPRANLSGKAKSDFDELTGLLREAQAPFELAPKLVRGLDYYTGCVFEVTAAGLGAQDAILAGGRYDSLIQDLGGPSLGASGFSIGVERLISALEADGAALDEAVRADTVYVAAVVQGKETCAFYRSIAQGLLGARKRAHYSFSPGSIANHLKRANKMKAAYVLIVGEDEWKSREVSLKRMDTGVQKRLKPEALKDGFTSG
jgi:histidyl-tRNA synthetase